MPMRFRILERAIGIEPTTFSLGSGAVEYLDHVRRGTQEALQAMRFRGIVRVNVMPSALGFVTAMPRGSQHRSSAIRKLAGGSPLLVVSTAISGHVIANPNLFADGDPVESASSHDGDGSEMHRPPIVEIGSELGRSVATRSIGAARPHRAG